jgi:hypothetical protein
LRPFTALVRGEGVRVVTIKHRFLSLGMMILLGFVVAGGMWAVVVYKNKEAREDALV